MPPESTKPYEVEEPSDNDGRKKSGRGKDKQGSRKPRGYEERYGSSRHRRGSSLDSSEDGKGVELVRRGRKSKDDSPLENSASDSRRKKSKSKSKPKDKSKSKESKARRHEESSEDSDSSGEEYIVTKRNRYRDVDQRELPEGYAEAILRIFQVQPSKLERWCDAGYIRLDTKENCFNCDPVIEMAGKAERQEWVIFEKKYKRQIKEAVPTVGL